MLSNISDMTDRELLMELFEEKRRSETLRNLRVLISLGFLILLVVLGFIYLPPLFRTAGEINASLKEINAFLADAEGSVHLFEDLARDFDMSKINDIADTMKELEPIIQALGSLFGQ